MKSEVPPDTMQRVHDLVKERNMSISQLSKKSGVAPSTFRRADERGTQLAVDTIFRICNALDISMSEFFAVSNSNSKAKVSAASTKL